MAAGLGMNAFGGKQILDAERDALQRAALALDELGVGGFRHVARLVGGDGDIGVERRIGAIDRCQIGLGDLGRGDLLAAQLGARPGDGEMCQVAHQARLFS